MAKTKKIIELADQIEKKNCPDCYGKGEITTSHEFKHCKMCDGSGKIKRSKIFKVLGETINKEKERHLYNQVYDELNRRMDNRLKNIDASMFPDNLFSDGEEIWTEEEKKDPKYIGACKAIKKFEESIVPRGTKKGKN